MGTISRAAGTPYVDGDILPGARLEGDFATIYDEFNGNIEASNLADLAVPTAKLDDMAVTQDKMTSGAASASEVQVEVGSIGYIFGTSYTNVGTAITHIVGNPARHVVLMFSCTLASSTVGVKINIKILKDAAQMQTPFFSDQHDFFSVSAGSWFQNWNRMYIDTAPTPGATHVYQLQMKTQSGSCGAFNLNRFAFEPRS